MYAGAYQNFSYYKDEEGHLSLVFKHNFGIKWSRIISSAYCHCIEKTLTYHTAVTILPSIVTIKVLEKSAADIMTSD
jgi:hypothetical protein